VGAGDGLLTGEAAGLGAGSDDGDCGPVQAAPARTAASSTLIRAARAAKAALRPGNATAEL
jgi:hypothetical protein